LGITCCGDEGEAIKGLERMEVRDSEVLERSEEGNKTGYL